MKSYVFIAMVICSIIIYPFEAKSQDSGDLRIKSVTLVDGTVISAQNYAATDAAATDELQVKSVEFTDGTIIEADHFEILDQNMKKTGNDNDKSNTHHELANQLEGISTWSGIASMELCSMLPV